MAKIRSQWCKNVNIRLIELDMSIQELAKKVGLSREYISAIVHGRVYSKPAIKVISDILNIKDDY